VKWGRYAPPLHCNALGTCTAIVLARLQSSWKNDNLLNTRAAITAKGAGFKSLGDVWADTTTPHGRLMLTVFGGLAEFERELICARTSEGRVRAKARGVHLGRRPKLTGRVPLYGHVQIAPIRRDAWAPGVPWLSLSDLKPGHILSSDE
jgi:DNA invertase Pin-like site-specific DNA recombinase